jgi:hypothetical protein
MTKKYLVSNEMLQDFITKVSNDSNYISHSVDASSGGANATIPYCTIVYVNYKPCD